MAPPVTFIRKREKKIRSYSPVSNGAELFFGSRSFPPSLEPRLRSTIRAGLLIFKVIFVAFYFLYIIVYVPLFLNFGSTHLRILIPFHFFGMALGLAFLIVVLSDIYKRDFPNPNSKITWTILILMFMPSVFVYLFRYALRLV